MYPTKCTFYLSPADEYANSVAGLTQDDPTVLETYTVDKKFPTEEALLERLKTDEALSWATFRIYKAVVICKPHEGHVALVQPLKPLVERKLANVIRHANLLTEYLTEAARWQRWSYLYTPEQAVLPVSVKMVDEMRKIIDQLWEERDILFKAGMKGSADYAALELRTDLLTSLLYKVTDALTEGVAFVVVEATR